MNKYPQSIREQLDILREEYLKGKISEEDFKIALVQIAYNFAEDEEE